MTQPDIDITLHFEQPRDGALKGVGAVAFGVERIRVDRGRTHQVHVMLVERVDQGEEALGFVAPSRRQIRYVGQNNRVEPVGDGEVVGTREIPAN